MESLGACKALAWLCLTSLLLLLLLTCEGKGQQDPSESERIEELSERLSRQLGLPVTHSAAGAECAADGGRTASFLLGLFHYLAYLVRATLP